MPAAVYWTKGARDWLALISGASTCECCGRERCARDGDIPEETEEETDMLTVEITPYSSACGTVVAYSQDGAYATVRDGSRTYTGRVIDRVARQTVADLTLAWLRDEYRRDGGEAA
jgi:hypothetical protein